jgi:hypothetical protein
MRVATWFNHMLNILMSCRNYEPSKIHKTPIKRMSFMIFEKPPLNVISWRYAKYIIGRTMQRNLTMVNLECKFVVNL